MIYLTVAGMVLLGWVFVFYTGYRIGLTEGSRRARTVFQQRSEEVIPHNVPLVVDSKGTAVLVAPDDKG